MSQRESNRLRDANRSRVLDDDTRKRRMKKTLEALEQDNYQDDPHADVVQATMPKFSETLESRVRKKRKKTVDFKQKLSKTLPQMLEEDKYYNPEPPNYFSIEAPPSELASRHFCAVCGFFSKYKCVSCGARYCSIKCYNVHYDTRCLKWTT